MADPALAESLPLAPSYVTAPEVTYDLAHTDRVPDRTIPRMKALLRLQTAISNCGQSRTSLTAVRSGVSHARVLSDFWPVSWLCSCRVGNVVGTPRAPAPDRRTQDLVRATPADQLLAERRKAVRLSVLYVFTSANSSGPRITPPNRGGRPEAGPDFMHISNRPSLRCFSARTSSDLRKLLTMDLRYH